MSRGGWVRFPRLWSRFWPSSTCVCLLLLGWKDCPFQSMKQELFDIVFASSVVFTISAYCNLCEGVCSCLLLMGWNGRRLVCLFAVAGGRAVPSGGVRQKLNRFWLSVIRSYHARVGGLAQALFRRLGFSAPILTGMTGLSLDQWCCICLSFWKGCSKGSMKQELIDIVFTSLLSFSFSVSFSYWLHLGGRLGSWREVRQSSLKLNFDITLSRGGWARFPRLWSYFWPSFTCVCRLLLGGRVVPLRAWSKSSLALVSLLCVSFTISYLFHLGESVGWLLRGGPAKLSQLKLWHYFEQGRSGKVPSAMVSLLAFLYMCLSAVAGVEGLSI